MNIASDINLIFDLNLFFSVLFGEDVAFGGVFRCSVELKDRYGKFIFLGEKNNIYCTKIRWNLFYDQEIYQYNFILTKLNIKINES